MFRLYFIAVVIALIGFTIVGGPYRPSMLAQAFDPRQISPEQRRAIQLGISTNGTSSDFRSRGSGPEKRIFKLGEPVHIWIVMTNTATQPVRVCAESGEFYQNRPELARDGKRVPYADTVKEVVRQSDWEGLCEFTSPPAIIRISDLKPNVPFRVPSIKLQDWYGSLAAGQYTLVIKRTFACCADGQWNSSNAVNFDVTP